MVLNPLERSPDARNYYHSSSPPSPTTPCHERHDFMGTWFVVGVKPTLLETTCSNAVEIYTRRRRRQKKNDKKQQQQHDIDIDFRYNKRATPESPLQSLPQKGWIQGDDAEDSALWTVSPIWPIKMPYLILEADENCQEYAVIGYPSRQYCWILSRRPSLPDATYQSITERLTTQHHYDLTGLRKVPHLSLIHI